MATNDLTPRTAVVTGASRGFGRAITAELVERLGVPGDADHADAVGDELRGDRPAEAPARAGDHCGSRGQIVRCHLLLLFGVCVHVDPTPTEKSSRSRTVVGHEWLEGGRDA